MNLTNLTYDQIDELWTRINHKRWHFEEGEWKSKRFIHRMETAKRQLEKASRLKGYQDSGIYSECPLKANIEHMKREWRV